jgi:uncharacterized protein
VSSSPSHQSNAAAVPSSAREIVEAARWTARRITLVALGSASLGLGLIGIFVPLLPTTCFLLLAAWCYARSSPRLYAKLFRMRWVGEYLRRYRDEHTIPRRVKIVSLGIMWAFITYGVLAFPNMFIRVTLLVIAIGVTWHVAMLRASEQQ